MIITIHSFFTWTSCFKQCVLFCGNRLIGYIVKCKHFEKHWTNMLHIKATSTIIWKVKLYIKKQEKTPKITDNMMATASTEGPVFLSRFHFVSFCFLCCQKILKIVNKSMWQQYLHQLCCTKWYVISTSRGSYVENLPALYFFKVQRLL